MVFAKICKLREELIPEFVLDFWELPSDQQENILYMVRYACRLHLLAYFVTAADKGMIAYEKAVCTGFNPQNLKNKSGESGTHRLIRTAAKAFTLRG